MDLKTLSDADLETLRIDVGTEQDQRHILATIPDAIATLATQYRDGGGGQGILDNAITAPPATP